MTQKFTAEEVRAFRNITFAPSDPGYAITSAFADRIEADERAVPAAWCSLTPNGQIAYFDGKPMIMPGNVGNEHHPDPLFTYSPAQAAQVERGDALDQAEEDAELEGIAYADTLSKPADSGRVGDEVVELAVRIHDREDAAQKGEPDPWADEFPEPYRSERVAAMRLAITAALAAQGQGEATGMREGVAYFVDDSRGGYWQTVVDGNPYTFRIGQLSAPPASPAGVPDALRVWAMAEGAPAGDPMYEAARGHVREMLKAAPSAPEGDGGAE